MARELAPNTAETKFESAKRAANNERDARAATHDETTARLKAQRLAKEAEKKAGETPSKREK